MPLQIGIDKMTGAIEEKDVFLIDQLLGKAHDLQRGPYSFLLQDQGEIRDRFVLQFQSELPEYDPLADTGNRLVWHWSGEDLLVSNKKGDPMTLVQVFDLNGRLLRRVLTDDPEVRIFWGNLPDRSIFLIRAVLADSRVLSAKILL